MIHKLKLGAESTQEKIDEWIKNIHPSPRCVLILRFENTLELWAFTGQGYHIPEGAELIRAYKPTRIAPFMLF
jgi:hypothetical protein